MWTRLAPEPFTSTPTAQWVVDATGPAIVLRYGPHVGAVTVTPQRCPLEATYDARRTLARAEALVATLNRVYHVDA